MTSPGSMLQCGSRHETHHILIEEVNNHVSQSSIAPVSMNQEEFFQVFEASYSEITRHDRLETIKTFRQREQQTKQWHFQSSRPPPRPACPPGRISQCRYQLLGSCWHHLHHRLKQRSEYQIHNKFKMCHIFLMLCLILILNVFYV